MEAKNIGIWIRVSTEMQVKGESPEHHEQRARLYAEAKGWNVVEVYRLEAVSGKSVMEHPITKKMMHDVKERKIEGLIFSKLARLARNTKELLEFSELFKKHNADLISLQESIDTSSPAGRLFYTMIAAMATWEREEIAERVSASVPIRAKMGKPLSGTAPLGYKWENGEFVIDPETAPIRKLIYEIFLETRRKITTAKRLNDLGYRSRKGEVYSGTTIDRLIIDPTAKGVRIANYRSTTGKNKPESEWVYHTCPPIVSEELWNQCNNIIKEQKAGIKPPGPKAVYLLSGYLNCENGHPMYVYHNTPNPKFRCRKCNINLDVADMDEIYHEQLKTFLLTETDVKEYIKNGNERLNEKMNLLETTQNKLTKIRKEIKDLIDLRIKGELNAETLAPYIKPLEEQANQLEYQLPALEADVDFLKIEQLSSETVLHGAKDLYNNWKTLPFEEKRSIIEVITKGITVSKSSIDINLSYQPSSNTHISQKGGKNPLANWHYWGLTNIASAFVLYCASVRA